MKTNELKPTGNLVLVKLEKYKTRTVTTRHPKADADLTKELDPDKDLEFVKEKVKYDHQFAEVLAIGSQLKDPTYKVGDTIVYHINSAKNFDLIKGTALIADHNIIGVVVK